MDDMKLLSTEAEGVNEAIAEEHRKALVNGAGRVGALLGLQSPQDNSSASADDEADSTGMTPCKGFALPELGVYACFHTLPPGKAFTECKCACCGDWCL